METVGLSEMLVLNQSTRCDNPGCKIINLH